MKKISRWARCNITTSWYLIACIKIILIALSFYTGILLFELGIILPSAGIYLTAMLTLFIVMGIYPNRLKSTLSKKIFYARQKTADFILPFLSCLVMITMVNNGDVAATNSGVFGVDIVNNKTAAEILSSGKARDELNRKEKKVLKKELYKQLKIYAKAIITGNEETSGKAGKIILAIIALVGLLYLLAALACSLSCSGSDTAAILVAALGFSGVIFGFVLIMKRIHKGPKKINEEQL